MNATLSERNLGSVRWLVVSGQAGDCFRALGHRMRAEIREAVTEWDATRALRADPTGESPCTLVANLADATATLQWRGEPPVSVPMRHLTAPARDQAPAAG